MVLAVSSSLVSTPYIPKVVSAGVLDKVGGLYEAKLPDSSEEDISTGLVYSAKGLTEGSAVPSSAVYLKDTEGAYFSLSADKISMVASGQDLNLYVYSEDGTADQYTFGVADGKLKNATPTTLDAVAFSAVEASSKRDLDGNTGIGALLSKTGPEAGTLDVVGGLFRVQSMGQSLFVVGAGLDKAKAIDASKSTLLTSDGEVWTPEEGFSSYRATSSSSKDADGKVQTTWTVYAADAQGQTTQFKFDADKKLIDEETKVLSARDLASLEKQTLRDLNLDNKFGVEITGTLDTKTGLFKGKVLEQEFYLVGDKLKSGTAKAGTDLSGSLLNADGEAWALTEGYKVGALVKNKTGDAAYSIYAYRDAAPLPADATDAQKTAAAAEGKKDVLRFDFVAKDGNFEVSAETVDGVVMDATAMAAAEKAALRDLNSDSVFGVKIDSEIDKLGGLYKASALGHEFLLVGKGMTSSASKPGDLSTALRTADGEAWKPEDVATLGTNLRIVKGDAGYDIFVKEDAGTFAKYSFDTDFKLKADGDRQELSREDLATAEKTLGRDLNGDSAFGVKVTALKDAKSGLYVGEFEDQKNVYLRSEAKKLTIDSKVAANGVDLGSALQTEEGYWAVDEGYAVSSAYVKSDMEYVVVATAATGENKLADIRQFTFGSDNKLIEAKSGDMSVIDLAAAEKLAGRDLNGDGVKAVKINSTVDKVGGLHKVESAGQVFYAVGAKTSDIKDLSSTLLQADGAVWAPPSGETEMVMNTVKVDGAVMAYEVYAKGSNGSYTRYTFDANQKYIEDDPDNAKVLSLIELADAEKTIQRDINGDKSIGAAVASKPIDKTGGLYTASIGGESMTIVSAAPGKSTSLSDKVLLGADGQTPWKLDTGYVLQAAVTESNGNVSIYANKVGDATGVRRYTFDAARVFSEAEDLTAEQMVSAEKSAGRDFNADKAVGLNVTAAVDKKGGLYKASVLGQDFFVLGQLLKTGKTGDTAVDLSKALLDGDGNAWKVSDGFTVAGVVKNADKSADVYTFKNTAGVLDVEKHSWDANMQFMGTAAADPVSLVEVEAANKRDFSGDGVVGFNKLSTSAGDGYLGVTAAKVSGNVTFLLAGTNLRGGTPTNPLTLKDALLNEDGSGPWQLDVGFKVKAVDDTGTDRIVYAVKAGADRTEEVMKFTFSKTEGKLMDEGVSVSAVDLAAREIALKKDLNDDKKSGVATVTDLTDGNRSTGLLKATVMGNEFLVVNKMPQAGKNISLASALLSADDSAWTVPDGFTVKGVFQNAATSTTEVYGVDAESKIARYQFEAVDGSTSLKLKDETTEARTVAGVDLAQMEAIALKDLNGDGSIGFKVTDDKLASQSNGWTVGKAGVNAEPDAEIYIVGKSLGKMGTVATNLANSAALMGVAIDNDAPYWKPDEGYSVISVVQTADNSGVPDKVNLYAKKPADGDNPTSYLKYTFTFNQYLWRLDSAVPQRLTSKDMVTEEAKTKRDLNNDTAVGVTVTSSTAGLSQAEIDGQKFYLVGNLSTGTGTRPQDLNKMLTDAEGNAWKPDAEAVLTNWRLLSTAPEGAPETAKFALTVNGTDQYFDADYKSVAFSA